MITGTHFLIIRPFAKVVRLLLFIYHRSYTVEKGPGVVLDQMIYTLRGVRGGWVLPVFLGRKKYLTGVIS
jgi:hypothetical protein